MIKLGQIPAALLAAAIATPAWASDAPADAAGGFYGVVVALHEGGIPDAKGRAALRPHVSPRLDALLARADRAELAYAENTKHAVPPLLEGDIFVSLFEGATGFRVGVCREVGANADCAADLTYRDGKAKPVQWTDHVKLTREAGGWRVDDIAYGAGWDFANKGTLQDNLTYAIRNASGN